MPRHERARHAEQERKPDARSERLSVMKAEFAMADEDAEEAAKALKEARAHAESPDGRRDPEAKREIEAIGKDAEAAFARYEALRKKLERLRNPGEFEGAIAEDVVTKAVVSAVVPEPVAVMAETTLTAAKAVVEAETEETPEERRRKKLGEGKN